eukprot:4454694-Amphidinium_carterae.1
MASRRNWPPDDFLRIRGKGAGQAILRACSIKLKQLSPGFHEARRCCCHEDSLTLIVVVIISESATIALSLLRVVALESHANSLLALPFCME